MNEILMMLVGVMAKLLLIAAVLLYASLVAVTYVKEGPYFQLRWELGDPARSAERLLIWMGIKVITAMVRAFKRVLDLLYDASADVGTWVVSKSNTQVRERVASRFL
jgi:hypothetical protein